jgi:hypothetical protein
MVPAEKPVNMTFTVTAKERYLWTLELKRRGVTAVIACCARRWRRS